MMSSSASSHKDMLTNTTTSTEKHTVLRTTVPVNRDAESELLRRRARNRLRGGDRRTASERGRHHGRGVPESTKDRIRHKKLVRGIGKVEKTEGDGVREKHVRAAKEGEERRRGRPLRPGFIWNIGARLEAKDFMDHWYSAKIIAIDDNDRSVCIHFDGWNQRYDEWVKMNSNRLRPLTRHSDRKKSPRNKLAYKAGESVYARWTDCRMYPAKIVAVTQNGSYEVMFNDGVKKIVKPINVDMKPPLSSIGVGNRPSESPGRRSSFLTPEGDTQDTSVNEERPTRSRKLSGGSVRAKRLSSASGRSDEDRKRRTISVGEEERPVAEADVCMDDQPPVADQLLQAEDITDSSSAKRRLIHVKAMHVKLKKLAKSPPSSAVDSKPDEEPELKCPHANCNKVFRNSTLVQYHIKYYHPEDRTENAAMEQKVLPSVAAQSKTKFSASSSADSGSEQTESRRKAKVLKLSDGCQSITAGTEGDGDVAAVSLTTVPLSSASVSATSSEHTGLPSNRFPKGKESRDWRRRGLRTRKRQKLRCRKDSALSRRVINCACRGNSETSPLIQCSLCLCWQHLPCLTEQEKTTAELMNTKYICRLCTSPRGLRESARYGFDQSWLVEGQLAEYSGSLTGGESKYGSAGKAKIMKVTHQLVADLHNIQHVIDSVDRCIYVAREKSEPEFSHWISANLDERNAKPAAAPSVDNGEPTTQEDSVRHVMPQMEEGKQLSTNEDCGLIKIAVTMEDVTEQPRGITNGEQMTNGKTQSGHFATYANSQRSAGESSAGISPESQELVRIDQGGENEGTMKHLNGEHSCLPQNDQPDPPEGKNMKHWNSGIADTTLGTNISEKEDNKVPLEELNTRDTLPSDEDIQTGDAQNQLLLYISRLQNGIEDSIGILDEQVTALEKGEGNGNSSEDILRDLPRVKKTINQLMTDLHKVQTMSFCH